MTYTKAKADVICFLDTDAFMTYSGGKAGQAAAEAAALANDQVLVAIAGVGGNAYARVNNAQYDPSTGLWTITVGIYNNGGHQKTEVIVIE